MVLNIPHYFQYNGEKKIALLDNTAVQFMQQLDDKGYHPDFLLKIYDVILLPQWVVEEIQDSDFYEFQKCAEKQLKKKDNYKNKVPVSVTYRSNDSILCQMYRDNQLTTEEIRGIRNNERYVTYMLTHEDKSVELTIGRLDKETFVNLIQDESFQIIF